MAMFLLPFYDSRARLQNRKKDDYAATNNNLSAKSDISERKCFAKLYKISYRRPRPLR